MNNYIIIGSKYYKNIKLDNLLDTFNKNIDVIFVFLEIIVGLK